MNEVRWTDGLLASIDRLQDEVRAENRRQIDKWGQQTHTPAQWFLILGEELGELGQEVCAAEFDGRTPYNLRKEAIQVATLALKIAEMAGGASTV